MEDGGMVPRYDERHHPEEMERSVRSFLEEGASFLDEGASMADSFYGSSGEDDLVANSDAVPDLMMLNLLCARAKAPKESEESLVEAEKSWGPVRDWLSSHNADEVRAAAEQRGESGLTALHFAARHDPPLDVIDVLLSIAQDTVQWPDSFGWLPIHYACASGSDTAVIKTLADAYPESKTTVDRRGRTPLHFALGDKPASPDVIFLLSSSGAAQYPDEIGMLPLHYACAFGASEEVLYVLTDAYPEAIKTKDRRDRTPLHFALSNAGRNTVPSAVRLLLSLNKEIVNSIDGGPLPIRVLKEYTNTIKPDDEGRVEKRESVRKCLEHLLNAKPNPTADFLTTLQSLPDWLSERAVVMPAVQTMLNEKISRRFPTGVLMMDFYVIVAIIFNYSFAVAESIHLRYGDHPGEEYRIETSKLILLYVGAAYFLIREIVQVISLIFLKSFKIWLYDPSNYLNIAFVFVVVFWTIEMDYGLGDNDSFRVGATISVIWLWIKLLAYLRNMLIGFAVFVGGVFYVVKRLAAFLVSLFVILVAFAQMFNTVLTQTPYCNVQPYNEFTQAELTSMLQCGESISRPYCDFWNSFLGVYTMLLGEVSTDEFKGSPVGIALFVIFMFLCVILLANVLIAIVSDSYKVIQDQRAAIVFWTNRLDFIAEMDAIANGPWKKRLKKTFGFGEDNDTGRSSQQFGQVLWVQTMELFEDDVEGGVFSLDFFLYTVLRLIVAVFVIPLWLFMGLVTLGWCWPPQIRERVFISTVFQHSSDSEKADELRRTHVKILQEEVIGLKDELLQELALDRTQVVQMKSQVAERKLEISNEMKEIKKIVAILFERQTR